MTVERLYLRLLNQRITMISRLPKCNDSHEADYCSPQYINEPCRCMDLKSVFERHLSGAPTGCEDNTELFDSQGDAENDWSVLHRPDDICDLLEMKDEFVARVRARAIRVHEQDPIKPEDETVLLPAPTSNPSEQE